MVNKQLGTATIVLLLFLYLLIVEGTGDDIVLVQERIITPQQASYSFEEDEGLFYQWESNYGYLDREIASGWRKLKQERITGSNYYYSTYRVDEYQFPLFNTKGEEITRITTTGLPYILGRRIFAVEPFLGVVEEWSPYGDQLWRYTGKAVISTLSTGGALLMVGFINGEVHLLDREGNLFYLYRPGGSVHQVIYGGGLSDDNVWLAIVSGLEPQFFWVLEKLEEGYYPHFMKEIETPMKREVLTGFIDNSIVYHEASDHLYFLNLETEQERELPFSGLPENITVQSGSGFISTLISYSHYSQFSLLDHHFNKIYETTFQQNDLSLEQVHSKLIFFMDNNISVVTIEGAS